MRTPGNDFELAAGFRRERSHRALPRRDRGPDVLPRRDVEPEQRYNIVTSSFAPAQRSANLSDSNATLPLTVPAAFAAARRSIRSASAASTPLDDGLTVRASLLYELPERMRASQRVFAATGGLHAAALFDERGDELAVREDVGRHNAVDKIVGWALLEGRLPFSRSILMVSGRASYEILQKCVVARIPILAPVSAPSSLAVELAREFDITLAGFVRGDRANVYSGEERLRRD